MNPESATRLLREHKLSITSSRVAILNLLAHEHRILTIEQIIQGLKKEKQTGASLVFTTVYRCLLKMEESGLVKQVDLGDGLTRYEIADDHDHHHHHVICKKCRTITPLTHCEIGKIQKAVERMGYRQITHRLEFSGICAKCSKEKATD